MKIVVGLGNPGRKYQQTRHNVGFDVLSCIARRYDVGPPKARFKAEVAETIINNEKTVLVSPLTFMNLSGQSVRAAVEFYKIDLAQLLIICDDINLDVGRLRLRASGSAGGQNGLKDIIQRLNTDHFARLRIGVGRVPPKWDTSNFVLGKFDSNDRSTIDKAIERAADAVEVWIDSGIQPAMNQFNANPNKKPKPKNPPRQSTDTASSKDDAEQASEKTDGKLADQTEHRKD
ncbi:MAG: aminoacyl-tRNA hydrolase [Planctomycetota bacterium]